MKPSQTVFRLRQIAADLLDSPDREAALRKLRLFASSLRTAAGSILVHRHGDGTYVDVTISPNVVPGPASGGMATIHLPNGDSLEVASSLDALKGDYPDGMDDELLEALFNAGLIETDDEGNYLV